MPSRRSGRGDTLTVLFVGDIIGQPGRDALVTHLPSLRDEFAVDVVVANGENAAGGTGITPSIADELFRLGIAVLTTGNHVWAKKEIIEAFDARPTLLRPANYPPGAPGSGSCIVDVDGVALGVVNLCGRVFMNPLDCPFRTADTVIDELRRKTSIILVDIHAEATSEKTALAWYLDGRVSAVLGTHTHVQTSDARVLPRGTAYVTDVGMTGPTESVIGMRTEVILTRFLSQMPQKFEVARQHPVLEGAVVTIETRTGRARSVTAIRRGGAPSSRQGQSS